VRAVIADELGGPWRLAEVPEPEPGPRDVVVRIEASGICFTDVHQLREPAFGTVFPRIPGHEPVGVIERLGSEVTEFTVGDRVGTAWVQRWCGHCPACERGRHEHCGEVAETGTTIDGGHAELCLMDAGAIEKVPAGLDPIEAAPVFCAGYTAYSAICDAEVRPGEVCAVVGVGGLGHLAVQYLKALGAEVVAVTGAASKGRRLRELGADDVVVAEHGRAGVALKRRGGADVILNTATGLDPALLQGLRKYGRLCLVGQGRTQLELTPTDMIISKLRVIGSSQGPRQRLREVLELHARSGARTMVETYPLDRALEAFDRVAGGEARLRAVLVP
jgi:D-arabinose 1-dehydrogenase-like Zn-dependent alcohol dehydrogenase